MTVGDDPLAEADGEGSGIARRFGSELTSSPPGMTTPGKRNSGGLRPRAESNESDPF
jgi:hypothetical protein